MKYIDRLIIKAKKLVNSNGQKLIQAFITFDETKGVYTADGRIWNGVKDGGITIAKCECNTEGEAFEALHELGKKYPNNKPVVVIFGDYDLED